MPVLETDRFEIDYLDEGSGPNVVLVHSSASNYRQWRKLIDDYSHRYRFLAINLFGYGGTTAWPGEKKQQMADQVALVSRICEQVEGPLFLVGHSFGGSVAAWTARQLGERVSGLVLLEANPFPLLEAENHHGAYDEICVLRDAIKSHGGEGNWESVASRFVDYWVGEGAWEMLPTERRKSFVAALPNNYLEWDAVMEMETDAAAWREITANTLCLMARGTVNSIRGIHNVLKQIRPDWHYALIEEGGHMAPVTHPDIVNPLIIAFFES